MTFEFDYNTDTDEITIVYDGTCVLKSYYDGEKVTFKNFEKLKDEEIEVLLKNLCRQTYDVLG